METNEKIIWAIVGLGIFAIIGFSIFLSLFSLMTPGSGQHTGYVTAVETYGIIWKTSRVYVKTDTQSSQEDTYCVQDSKLIEELKKVQESKEKVTLEFSSPLVMPKWKCGNESSVIINVKM